MLEEAVEIDALGGEKGLVSPMRILNPSWKILETDQVADIQNGKRIVLDTPEDQVILVHDDMILAAYQREKGKQFRCVRGLF